MTANKTMIEGEFEVKMLPAESLDPKLGSMSLDKVYRGQLDATGKGSMLTGQTDIPTSAVYVAIEKVSGTLDGKSGSFILFHRGIMEAGEQQLEIRILPDSGTNELAGIRGSMGIDLRDGKHFYQLEYYFKSKT